MNSVENLFNDIFSIIKKYLFTYYSLLLKPKKVAQHLYYGRQSELFIDSSPFLIVSLISSIVIFQITNNNFHEKADYLYAQIVSTVDSLSTLDKIFLIIPVFAIWFLLSSFLSFILFKKSFYRIFFEKYFLYLIGSNLITCAIGLFIYNQFVDLGFYNTFLSIGITILIIILYHIISSTIGVNNYIKLRSRKGISFLLLSFITATGGLTSLTLISYELSALYPEQEVKNIQLLNYEMADFQQKIISKKIATNKYQLNWNFCLNNKSSIPYYVNNQSPVQLQILTSNPETEIMFASEDKDASLIKTIKPHDILYCQYQAITDSLSLNALMNKHFNVELFLRILSTTSKSSNKSRVIWLNVDTSQNANFLPF